MKRPILNADYINVAILVTLILIIFGLALGCKTACIPKVEIQEKLVPAPCVVQIGVLEELSLPPYPPFDATNPKEWALQVEQIAKQREALLKARVEALNYQIVEHNRLEPKCSR